MIDWSKETPYQNIDGEWQREPDFVWFTDKLTGYKCAIIRQTMWSFGNLCGYVILPEHHPLYKKRKSLFDEPFASLEVHWGVSFIGYLGAIKIEGHKLWAIGFDCAHAGDLIPGMAYSEYKYRNIAYVKKECRKLAKQLKELE